MTDLFDIIIYHANCFDGLTSAWVARKTSPNAQMVAASYGEDPPVVEGKRVLIVDFSYPRDTIVALSCVAKDLLVLDHHKSAAEALQGLPEGVAVFDMERSGAGLAWDYLWDTSGGSGPHQWHPVALEQLEQRRGRIVPKQQRIPMVDHVEDRDLWRFALHNTKAYHAAMNCFPMTFEAWDEIDQTPYSRLIHEGSAVLKFTDTIARKWADKAYTVVVDGALCWAINAPVELASEAAHHILDREPKRPVVMWRYNPDRREYYCSLRSRDDRQPVDTLATALGGGGHRNAAGFHLPHPPVPLETN